MYRKASTLVTVALSILFFVIPAQAQASADYAARNPHLIRGEVQCKAADPVCDDPMPISDVREESGDACDASAVCGAGRGGGLSLSDEDSIFAGLASAFDLSVFGF